MPQPHFQIDVIVAALPVAAQDATGSVGRLDGTLKKIKDSGVVVLGYRTNSPPFSSLDARGQPVGYSLDLCSALVDDIADELGLASLRIRLQPVTPENRIERVVSGEVDIECGSTTNTAARRRQVAFSPTIFVTGTKLLVRRDSRVRSLADLQGRSIAVTRGTTNAQVMQQLSQRRGLALSLVDGADHDESSHVQPCTSISVCGPAPDDVQCNGMPSTDAAAARVAIAVRTTRR